VVVMMMNYMIGFEANLPLTIVGSTRKRTPATPRARRLAESLSIHRGTGYPGSFLSESDRDGKLLPNSEKPCDRTRRFANVSSSERPAGPSIKAA
jgi:hypothetical protein